MASPRVIEEWTIIDRWWTDQPAKREFVEVEWHGRRVVLRRENGEGVWRIVEPKR